MSTESSLHSTWPVVLQLGPVSQKISDQEFFEFCQLNRDWRIERTSAGDLIIMPPTVGTTGRANASLTMLLGVWAETDGTGIVFDSSTGFKLPNGAERSPDAAWVRRERWDALTPEAQKQFPPLCPDFVVELRSPSDKLRMLREKMDEYMANGASLGWLIDPTERKVYLYQSSAEVLCVDEPATISGDPVLRGFVLDLHRVWG